MKVAIIAGSNRKGATSTQLCRYLERLLRERGAEAELYSLYEFPVPFYTKEDPEPNDANLRRLKKLVAEAQAVVLASPDYHGSVSGVLKNALDHLGAHEFSGKPVLAVSSAGGAVGVSALTHIQTIVRNLHGINCPEWISIGGENRTFNEQGEPASANVRSRAERTIDYFLTLAGKLS